MSGSPCRTAPDWPSRSICPRAAHSRASRGAAVSQGRSDRLLPAEYTRLRDEFDYAVARLDVRGTGSSSGRATDEYPYQEQRDLAEVIAWLAAKDWCDGNVGMYGTSYSGFNSLHMAAEGPPELKGVIAIYATDDRYTDDVSLRWVATMAGHRRLLPLHDSDERLAARAGTVG